MNTQFSSPFPKKEAFLRLDFWVVGLALTAGLILSVLSWLEICVEHCSANQDFRLFGLPFAPIGILFFAGLLILHALSRHYVFLTTWVGWLVATALGSELLFIAIQKYQIGHWCPVCLSIAASVAMAALVLSADYIQSLFNLTFDNNRGDIMRKLKQGSLTCLFIVLGFLMAFIGVTKPDPAEAAVNDIKGRLVFGSSNSPVEVYFVTDWFCPACRKLEPQIEALYPKIDSKVAFYFVDYPIHKKSLNFTPYNLAFLVNDKRQYFQARQALTELAAKTETPTDQDVMHLAQKYQIPFKELTFLDVKSGIDYFDKIVEEHQLDATPAIIIKNTRNHRVTKFEGLDEISQEKVLKAIESMISST
jgi:thiol-disulfide isomerase/thioredoxin